MTCAFAVVADAVYCVLCADAVAVSAGAVNADAAVNGAANAVDI